LILVMRKFSFCLIIFMIWAKLKFSFTRYFYWTEQSGNFHFAW
jgi:hypothetical protein